MGRVLHGSATTTAALRRAIPEGSIAAVERAFDELVQQGVPMIVGAAIGDNALAATAA